MVYRPKHHPKSMNQNKAKRVYDGGKNVALNASIRNKENTVPNREAAKAPYNFVPLNKSVVESEEVPQQDRYYSERTTGYIDCELETLTPIYVRAALTEEDVKNGKEAKNKSDFFSPVNRIRIPGSSLRGMIRNLVEIVSWSKFLFFEDKGFYYRGLADMSNLRKEYQNNMSSFDKTTKKSIYKMSAGYLKKIGFRYYIIPAESKNGKQFEQIPIRTAEKIIKDKGLNYSDFIFKAFKLDNDEHLVISGRMNNKKNDWIIYKKVQDSESTRIFIPDIDIDNYENDENRKKEANLLSKLKEYQDGIPCFYIKWKDEKENNRVSFGHTAMFRLAYTKSIGDHIPDNLKDGKTSDIPEAIFGKVAGKDRTFLTGRVFFEDALLINLNEDPIMDECIPEPCIPETLSGPKPTTFQHYLEQDSDNIKNLKHYNSDTNIRGYKLYWHKSEIKWKKPNEFNKNIDTKIKPIKKDTKFKFRIRFENLSQIELGALLFALKLPHGCAHKIGMGKPIGLGSVKIRPALFVSDRQKRYSALFDNNEWALSEVQKGNEDILNIMISFEKYIFDKIQKDDKKDASRLWDTPRLKQLKLLLDVEKGKQLEKKGKIQYMSIEPNQFKDRKVLPKPDATSKEME